MITVSCAGNEHMQLKEQRKEKESETSKQDPLSRPKPKETALERKSMQHIPKNCNLNLQFFQ